MFVEKKVNVLDSLTKNGGKWDFSEIIDLEAAYLACRRISPEICEAIERVCGGRTFCPDIDRRWFIEFASLYEALRGKSFHSAFVEALDSFGKNEPYDDDNVEHLEKESAPEAEKKERAK